MAEQEWKEWPTEGGWHWLASKRKWSRYWSYEIVWVPNPNEFPDWRDPTRGWKLRSDLPFRARFSGPLKAPAVVPGK